MEYSFPHYLLAKQSVDDRALNRTVLESMKSALPAGPLRIIEVGAGVGTMLMRLLHELLRANRKMPRSWLPLHTERQVPVS